MKPANDLFLLIKSMSKSEKGYFKKFAGMHGTAKDGNYLKLFGLIDSMAEYDESLLKETLEKETFAKQLGVTKNYLSKLILRALANYHRDNVPELSIYQLLAEDAVLRHRMLSRKNSNRLKHAQNLATENSMPQFLPMIDWAKFSHSVFGDFLNLDEDTFQCWRQELLNSAYHLQQETAYMVLYMELYRSASAENTTMVAQYKTLLASIPDHPLMVVEPLHLSLNARKRFWNIWMRYYFSTNDEEKAIGAMEKGAQLFELRPGTATKPEVISHLNALNRLYTSHALGKHATAAKTFIDKIRLVDDMGDEGIKKHKACRLLEMEIDYLQSFGEPKQIQALEQQNGATIAYIYKDQHTINQGAVLALMGNALMLDEAPAKALDYLNQVTNNSAFENYTYTSTCWYWTILAHFQIGNKRILPSIITQASSALKHRLSSNPIEQQLLQDFKKLATTKSIKQEQIQLTILRDNLVKGFETLLTQNRYTEILTWINRKLGE